MAGLSGMDTTAIGELAAQSMGQISEEYGGECYVRTAALIVEVDAGDATYVLVSSTDDRPWVQIAFLHEGVFALEDRLAAARDEGES